VIKLVKTAIKLNDDRADEDSDQAEKKVIRLVETAIKAENQRSSCA
jgi:hypothetical protein